VWYSTSGDLLRSTYCKAWLIASAIGAQKTRMMRQMSHHESTAIEYGGMIKPVFSIPNEKPG
jgi:hypothetical protein